MTITKTALIALLLILIITGKWVWDSIDYGEMVVFSREKKPIVSKTIDDIFGTEVESTEYIDGFWLGILPGDDTLSPAVLLGVAPLSGIIVGITLIAVFIQYRKRKSINKGN